MNILTKIAISIVTLVILYVVLAPWLSIMDIHKSIDNLTDELREWRKERSNNGRFDEDR